MKLPTDLLQELTQQIQELAGQGGQLKEDMQHNIKALLQSQLQKLDLVTREEFELQQQALQKAKQSLADLQQQLSELEARLDKQGD